MSLDKDLSKEQKKQREKDLAHAWQLWQQGTPMALVIHYEATWIVADTKLPVSRAVSSLPQADHNGGCGFCTGFGSTLRIGILCHLVSSSTP